MSKKNNLLVIILTFNESLHIERCIDNIRKFTNNILVIDSFSTDNTIEVLKRKKIFFLKNKWKYPAFQFNWGLSQLKKKGLDPEWILRVDADETLDEKLIIELKQLSKLPNNIKGIFVNRYIKFLGKQIKYGGVFPIKTLRLFKYGFGKAEDRYMDEHIVVKGKKINFNGSIVDNNLNPITYWVQKHNTYSNNEVIDILRLKYKKKGDIQNFEFSQFYFKRFIKNNIYLRLPVGLRSLIFFVYRYFLMLGFLDGPRGFAFHFLQCFWYRYLVDIKLQRIEEIKNKTNQNIEEILKLEKYIF